MIVIPAVHPAHEVIARVAELAAGGVHRALDVRVGVGGKAVNVARFVAAMGGDVRLVLLGDPGLLDAVSMDPSLRSGSIQLETIVSPVPTRTDVAIVDDAGTLTVVNGTADDPGRGVVRQLAAAVTGTLAPGDVLVLAGSTPAGTTTLYADLLEAAHAVHAQTLVDASGPWLRDALAHGPLAVKVSEDEATGVLDPASASPRSAVDAAERPAGLLEPRILGITEGARGLRAWLPDGGAWRVEPPHGLDVVNPLGAGDAVTAGLAIALSGRDSPLDGFRLGTAMAAASLRHVDVVCIPDEVHALIGRVVVTRLR